MNIRNLLFTTRIFLRGHKYIVNIIIILLIILNMYVLHFKIKLYKAPQAIAKTEVIDKAQLLSTDDIKTIFNQLKDLECININSDSQYGAGERKGYSAKNNYEIGMMNINVNYIGRYNHCIRILDVLNQKGILWKQVTVKTIFKNVVSINANMSIIYNNKLQSINYKSHTMLPEILDPTLLFPEHGSINVEKHNISIIARDNDGKQIVIINNQTYERDSEFAKNKFIAAIEPHFIVFETKNGNDAEKNTYSICYMSPQASPSM